MAISAAAAGAALTTGLNMWNKAEDRAFNAEEAQKQRNWEEKMSNSAYQRSVTDMKKAGLNPAAMFGGTGGAANTPTGSSASSNSGTGSNFAGDVANLINSAANLNRSVNEKHELANRQAVRESNAMLKMVRNATQTELDKAKAEYYYSKKSGGNTNKYKTMNKKYFDVFDDIDNVEI